MSAALYGLMCVGLGLIFGVMRVINFAQGEFLMLGMYFTFYTVTGLGLATFLGPYGGAVRRRCPRWSGIDGGRLSAASLSGLARDRHPRAGRGERGPLRAAHPHPGRGAGAAERRADPVRLDAAIGAYAAFGQRLGGRPAVRRVRGRVRQQGARRVGGDLGRGRPRSCTGSSRVRVWARRCAPPPTIPKPLCTWASMWTEPIDSRSESAPA